MDLSNNFSVWNHLTPAQQELISTHLICRDVKKGTVLYMEALTAWDSYL